MNDINTMKDAVNLCNKLTWLGRQECVYRRIAWNSTPAACCQRQPWRWCGQRTWSSWDGLSCSVTPGWWCTSRDHRATYRTKRTSDWRSPVILLCTTHATSHQHPGLPLLEKNVFFHKLEKNLTNKAPHYFAVQSLSGKYFYFRKQKAVTGIR